jgi:hypothetical protein
MTVEANAVVVSLVGHNLAMFFIAQGAISVADANIKKITLFSKI